MNEALRQSTYVGPPPSAQPRSESGVAPIPLRQAVEAPQPVRPPPSSPSASRKQPVVFSGQQDDGDLWNLVQPPSSPPSSLRSAPAGVQSFEEALRRVDSSLEALVGAPASTRTQPDVIVEPIIEDVEPTRLEDLDMADPSDPAEAARLRRQRLLKRAMENMGTMPGGRDSGIASTPSGLAAPPPSGPSGISRGTPPPATSAELQLAQQIEQRYEQASRRDHFVSLGLAPTASKDQVKTAFINLAKIFHPDRLPPSLPYLAQKMSTVFEAIREAYEVLHDDARRAAWVAARASALAAASQQPNSSQASDLMKMGEVFFKKRDYRQADDHFARAHALDKSALSLAAQAWAIYMDPTRKAEGPQAKAMMVKALSLDSTCDRAHYQLGVIARVEGDMDRAEKHFREAVRVNPRHLEANQELRLIEMRRKKSADAPGKKGSGFFR